MSFWGDSWHWNWISNRCGLDNLKRYAVRQSRCVNFGWIQRIGLYDLWSACGVATSMWPGRLSGELLAWMRHGLGGEKFRWALEFSAVLWKVVPFWLGRRCFTLIRYFTILELGLFHFWPLGDTVAASTSKPDLSDWVECFKFEWIFQGRTISICPSEHTN